MPTPSGQPVLVTGGSGFIGGQLMRRLVEHHDRVYCLLRASSHIDEITRSGAHPLTGDVTDRESLQRALAESKAATVYHLAGLVRARKREEFAQVNTHGVENVAAACAACSNPPVLVVVSSLAAAGPGTPSRLRVETDPPAPVSSYGRSKLAGELAAAKYAALVPITIVRPSIVFGPGDRAVLEVFRSIARLGVCFIPGWSAHHRHLSLVHVSDLVDCLLLAADKGERLTENALPGQGIYFTAGEDFPTHTDLGASIAKALGKRRPAMIPVPGPLLRLVGLCGDIVGRARGRPSWLNSDKIAEALAGSWTCSSAKARSQLGWHAPLPPATLADQLRDTARWYREVGWL